MPPRAMARLPRRIGFVVGFGKGGSPASLSSILSLLCLHLGLFVTGCATSIEPAAFNPNQTGFASCQFAAEAHPAPFKKDDITYGESVRSRTGMTEAMRDCYERLDKIEDESADTK